MRHREIKRIVDGAKTAIIFIHGIVGTPDHFNEFIPLIPDDFSVYNILLDGHGKGVRDFSATSIIKWENQVKNVVDELALNHEKIIIVAHSMGTLFAIDQAIDNRKIVELFLLAVPIRLFLKPRMLSTSAKVYLNKISPNDRIAIAARDCYGIDNDRNIFRYLGWIPRYFELFSKINKTRKILPMLSVSCQAFQSTKDEIVSKSSIKYLKKHSGMTVNELKNSGHYYYTEDDLSFIKKEFEDMLGRALSEDKFQ